MPGKDLQYNMKVLTDQAQRDTEKLGKTVQDVGVDFDDTRTNAQKTFDLIGALSDDVEANLKDVKQTAEVVGAALGPELRAKLGDAHIEGFVADLQKMGVELDDVRANAQQAADTIAKVDSVKGNLDSVQGATHAVGEEFHKTAAEADNTRSVVANFAGNASQMLPGVSGALGPLNMAMGQFAEYATEGNIKLGKFIGAGVALAAVGIAMKSIADHAKKVAEAKAFDKDQVAAYTAEIRKGVDAAEALTTVLTNAGKVEFTFGDNKIDITGMLQGMGVSLDQFTQLVTGSDEQLHRWADTMKGAGFAANAVDIVVQGVKDSQGKLDEATRGAAAANEFFGTRLQEASASATLMGERSRSAKTDIDGLTAGFKGMGEAARGGKDAVDKEAQSAWDAAKAHQALVDALKAVQEKELEAIDSNYALEAANRAATEAAKDADAATTDQKDAIEGARQAAEEAALKYADVNAKNAEGKDKIRLMIDSLTLQAAALGPDSPVAQAINEYILQLAQIPTDIHTNLSVSGNTAGKKKGAQGGGGQIHRPGVYTVGDMGPEDVWLPDGAQVTTASDKRLGKGGGGVTINNITVNTGFVPDLYKAGKQVSEALAVYQRRSN